MSGVFPPVFDGRSGGAALIKRAENIQSGVQKHPPEKPQDDEWVWVGGVKPNIASVR